MRARRRAHPDHALEEVCEDVDKAIRLTVQKNLTTMKDDCAKILRGSVDGGSRETSRRSDDGDGASVEGDLFQENQGPRATAYVPRDGAERLIVVVRAAEVVVRPR